MLTSTKHPQYIAEGIPVCFLDFSFEKQIRFSFANLKTEKMVYTRTYIMQTYYILSVTHVTVPGVT